MRALVVLGAVTLTSACVAQTEPTTNPSRDERREPDRVLTLDECLKRFELDSRLSLCHVWETKDGTGLAGFVEHPQYKAVLERATKKDVSKIKLLPEESKTQARLGTVLDERITLHENPVDRPGDRDNVSELLRGEPVWILDQTTDGWLLVHSSDGYLGWVVARAIGDVDSRKMMWRLNVSWDLFRSNLDISSSFSEAKLSALKRASAIIEDANTFIGTPYLWGGKTKHGIDCSGLVQVCFTNRNIILPRDADQQANVGKLVATRWFKDALLPGDLLFFVSPHRGNVHHVAIYLGEGKYIEAAGKDVHISSMNPADKEYDAERAGTFAWARRVIE